MDEKQYQKKIKKNKKKEKKRCGVYATFRTKNRRTVPVAVFDAVSAVTVMVGLPNPKTKLFTVCDSPAAISTVPVLDFPMRISPPSRLMAHATPVASAVPVFFSSALMPSPPVIAPISIFGCCAVMVAVVASVAVWGVGEVASVTVRVTL